MLRYFERNRNPTINVTQAIMEISELTPNLIMTTKIKPPMRQAVAYISVLCSKSGMLLHKISAKRPPNVAVMTPKIIA